MQDGTIENVSSFIRKYPVAKSVPPGPLHSTSYREEENAVIDEEIFLLGEIGDKQPVAAVSSHNRMEQINDPAQQKTDRIIYAAEVENEVDDSEFNPSSLLTLLKLSVIIIKTLPPYHTLPALYRQKRILPPKREALPSTLSYIYDCCIMRRFWIWTKHLCTARWSEIPVRILFSLYGPCFFLSVDLLREPPV